MPTFVLVHWCYVEFFGLVFWWGIECREACEHKLNAVNLWSRFMEMLSSLCVTHLVRNANDGSLMARRKPSNVSSEILAWPFVSDDGAAL